METVPSEFLRELARAKAAGRRGDLRLLAYESRRLPWAAPGLRAVLQAQCELGAGADAKETLDRLVEIEPPGSETIESVRRAGQQVLAAENHAPAETLLFTGHMIDAPGRAQPRFPPTDAAEADARQMIFEAVRRGHGDNAHAVAGIAGGACGGDILFHEVCATLGIHTELLLALPPDQFIATSVQHGGAQWVRRFRELVQRLPTRILADGPKLPAWVDADDYSVWQRNNLWTLFNALSLDAPKLTLIALWDQGNADGPGGTDDLVYQVHRRGYAVERLPAERLKALA